MDVGEQQRERRCALGRRRDDDRVAALERVDDVVRGCSRRIGRRRDRADDSDGPRDLHEARLRRLRDHAHRPDPGKVAQHPHRLAPILGDLVGDVAKPGVADGNFRERAVVLGIDDRPADGSHDFVDLVLCRRIEGRLCGARSRDQRADDRRSVAHHGKLILATHSAGPYSTLIFASRITYSHCCSSS